MKLCPTCRRQYKDETVFCLEDGSGLETIVPQAVDPGGQYSPTPQPQKRSYGLLIGLIVVVLLGVGAVLAAGLVGAYFYFQSGSEVATDSPSPTPTLPPFGSDFSTPTPSPTKSPTPSPPPSPSPGKPTPTPVDMPDDDGDDDDVPTPPTAPTPPPNLPKQISGGVLNGKATSLPKPPYPPAARAVRAEGTVLVQVLVDENGNVVSANAVSGHPLLRAAAAQAARGAKFAPTKLAGQPVRVSGILTYNFTP